MAEKKAPERVREMFDQGYSEEEIAEHFEISVARVNELLERA